MKKLILPSWLAPLNAAKKDIDLEEEEEGAIDLLMSGTVGQEVTAASISAVLNQVQPARTVRLCINTFGGEVYEGTAIYNVLRARGNVETCVVGYAASIGSVIAQAGSVRSMMPGTMMMIHNPTIGAYGMEAKDAARISEMLDQIKASLVDIYHAHTKLPKKQISDMMDETTSMSAAQAKRLGFCDQVIKGDPAQNCATAEMLFNSGTDWDKCFQSVKDFRRGDEEQTNRKQKQMKNITNALAELGLIPSAEITDEAAVVVALRKSYQPVKAAADELPTVKNRVAEFETKHKTRVTAKVDAAITEKLVKAERREALIAQGVADEAALDAQLDDIRTAKGSAAPTVKRNGAPPVPAGEQNADEQRSENDSKIEALTNEAKTATAARAGVIAHELRALRGRANMFADAPATTATVMAK